MSAPLSQINIGRAATLEETPQPRQHIMPEPPQRPARPRICLIVDDSRVVRKISSQIVQGLGFQVIEAENGEEALARCRAAMPGLVLLDWDMPIMTGIQFITQLRALDAPYQPITVFCTSRGESSDIHNGIAAGADEYVTKPFTAESLKAKLERIGAI